MPTYYIIKCPKCGSNQATAAKVLKCKYCSKSTTITGAKGIKRVHILQSCENPIIASRLVQEFNMKDRRPDRAALPQSV